MSKVSETVDPEAAADADRQRVPVAGGTLVYERRELGKELVGLEDVDDVMALREALNARGLDRGAVWHLPRLDDGRCEP